MSVTSFLYQALSYATSYFGPSETALPSFETTPPFGKESWEKLGIEVNPPDVPQSLKDHLQEKCPFFEGRKVNETHQLIFLPKGISPEKLRNLFEQKDDVGFFPEASGKTQIQEGYWLLITKRPIPNSSGESFEKQKVMIPDRYRPPHLVEACAAVLIHKVSDQVPEMFTQNNYTRCTEESGGWPIATGSSGGGLDLILADWGNHTGISAVRTS